MSAAPFSLRLKPEVKAALEKEAALLDRSAAWVAQQAIVTYLAREEALRDSVREVLENDDGVRFSGEAVMAWMERWGDGHDEPFPEPDIFPTPAKIKKSA